MIKVKKTSLAKELEETIFYTDKSQEIGTRISFSPKRATEGSAGYDVRACIKEPLYIFPKEIVKIPIGVAIWIHNRLQKYHEDIGYAGLLMPRSSIRCLKLTNTIGLLDSDFQNEISFKYENTSEEETIVIQPGERIGQLVVIPVYLGELLEVEEFEEETERGLGGWGHTGKI